MAGVPMIVVDASVVAGALIDDGPAGDSYRAALEADRRWVATPHMLLEVVSAIRRRTRLGQIDPARAQQIVADQSLKAFSCIGAELLTDRMWQLRDNLTTYDASYVATAELLGCRFVTADARLAKAPGTQCEITLLQPSP